MAGTLDLREEASITPPRGARLPAARDTALRLGSVIDGWRIVRPIGRGGMAELLLAERADGDGEPSVLKFLHTHLADHADSLAMLEREGTVASAIHHPNVVRVERARWWEGRPYLVMEYIRGAPLATILRNLAMRGLRFGPSAVVAIGLRILRGLSAGHTARDAAGRPLCVVHRDVSPANVLISDRGEVKLIDFGIAKPVGSVDQQPSVSFKGKLRYAAPEQFLGEPVDPRTDLYAFGTVMWEALTSERLVDGTDVAALYRAVTIETTTPPSALAPMVPPELDRVVLDCLAHDRSRRPRSALELEARLLAAVPGAALVDEDDLVTALLAAMQGRPLSPAELEELGLERIPRRVRLDDTPVGSLPPAEPWGDVLVPAALEPHVDRLLDEPTSVDSLSCTWEWDSLETSDLELDGEDTRPRDTSARALGEPAPLISEIRELRPTGSVREHARVFEKLEPSRDRAIAQRQRKHDRGIRALALYLLSLAVVSLVVFAVTFWAAR